MRKVLIYLLVFLLIFSSVASVAAPGDIIHTGLKRLYRKGNTSDLDALLNDIINGADISNFYEETSDGKYVNVKEKEKEQLTYLESLVVANNIKTPEALAEYINTNKAAIDTKFNEISTSIAKPFEEIADPNKGNRNDYLSSSEAPKLKTPTNYTIPVPGTEDNTIKIEKLVKPTGIGATKWLYKIEETPTYLNLNDTLKGENSYSQGNNIKISAGQYLLLCVTDSDNKVKAYTSIKITADMVKAPRVLAQKDIDIEVDFAVSDNHSGATVISGVLEEGTWKVAVLDSMPDKVYVDSDFANSVDYTANMELVVANDVELDNKLEGFKKYIIVYSVKDEKVEKYNILEIPKDKVSGILNAKPLDGVLTLEKGSASGTTKVIELDLPIDASKWMYALVDNDKVVPPLDRVFAGSKPYEVGQDIPVSIGEHLMLLATDDNGKVKRYKIVAIEDTMIKSPPPMELYPGTHYKDIVKGDNIGQTKITVNSSAILDELFTKPISITWRYVVSKTPIAIPEFNGKVNNPKVFSSSASFDIATESELRNEEPFNRYLMLLATEGTGEDYKIKGYAMIDINRNHVKYPLAKLLSSSDNYSVPVKGSLPGTTRITEVKNTGIDNHGAWWYKVVKGANPPSIEFKESITRVNGFNNFNTTQNIAIEPNDYIVLVSVDRENKALGYANIKVESSQITATTAIPLKPIQNYEGPVPGSKAGSTKFTKLLNGSLTNVNGWMYKIGKTTFGAIETGADTTGYTSYTLGADIEGVAPNDRLLLVAVDSSSKIIASTEITLTSPMIRGKDGIIMNEDNYTIEKGSAPSTTKLTNLNLSGVDGYPYTGWKWMYKVLDEELTGSSLPYVNQRIDGALNYTEGRDILVNYSGKLGAEYGYVLLLATDSAGLTKAYAQIPINTANVRESAPKITGVNLEPGNAIDRTKFIGLVEGNKYLYKIDTKPFARPAIGDTVIGGTPYIIDGNIGFSVKIGSHIILYEVDNDNKVKAYCDFVVTENDLAKGEVVLSEKTFLEGSIVNGGEVITFTLSGDDKWNDVRNNKAIRDKLFAGLKANNQSSEWSKVVNALQTGGSGYIFVDGKTINIRLPSISDYNITEEQVIQLVIPPEAIEGAMNPLTATGKIAIKPTVRANISGTVITQVIRERDIKAGGATIVISLTDASWALDVSKILDNSYVEGVSEQSSTNWSKIKTAIKSIVATSDKVITITLPKISDVVITTKEVVNLKIGKELIVGATEDVVANPSFTLYPDEVKIELKAVAGKEVVKMQAPDNKLPQINFDAWQVELINATFKDVVTDKDISIVGLPTGLKPVIARKSDKILEIKVTGTASSSVVDGAAKLRIKSTAVKELNSIDSDDFNLSWVKGTPMDLTEVGYSLENDGIYLTMPNGFDFNKIEYSVNSKNGLDGSWGSVSSTTHKVYDSLSPLKIYVREKAQPKVFREVVSLYYGSAPEVSVVNIKYYVDDAKDKVLQMVVLESTSSELEYYTGSGEWHTLVNGTVSGLDSSSALTIRKKASLGDSGVLPSLPTPKLNGLFLGDVKLDVSQSKIIGATKDMKYKLSSDGTWNTISINDPVVDFKEGNQVWISEAKNENNAKLLGTVSQAKMDSGEIALVKKSLANETDTDGIYYHIGDKKITNKTGINLQYNITKGEVPTGNWIDLGIDATANNVNFVVGNVFVRKIVDSNSLPSNPVKIFEIAEPIAPPKIEVNDDSKTLRYEASDGAYILLDDSFEYKINTGEYQNGSFLATDPKRLGNVTVYVKRKATKELLASKEINFKFTENISLANVRVNVAEGVIEGTTTKMEYRTDENLTEPNSPWKTASTTKTSINMYEGMNIWIRELGKPSTEKLMLENLGKMASPDKSVLEYNIAQKFIKNNYGHILEYRINDGNWSTINVGQTIGIEFVPTRLSIRTKATVDKLASDVVHVIDSLAYPDVAPEVVGDDIGNGVASINGAGSTDWSDYEFKLKTDSEWMPANLLGTYDLSGDKVVQIRKKGDKDKLPSEIAEVIFTKNIYLDKVELRETTPLRLLYTEPEMEYQVYLKGKPIPTTWTKATAGTTTLDSAIKFDDIILIVIRDARTKNGDKVIKGNKSDLPVDLSGISYEITSSEIVFTGITNRMRYKLSSSTVWENGTGGNVNTGKLEVMEITVEDNLYPTITRTIAVSERAETPKVTLSKVDYINSEITLEGFDKTKMEYSIDGGENWKSDADDNIFKITKGDILVVRAKAEAGIAGVGKLPSLPTKQLNGTSLVDVKVDVQNNKLLGTTKSMEYSLNSTDGKNGTWKPANDNETIGVQQELGTVIWIREIGNIVNSRKIGPIGQEPIPDLTSGVYFNISTGKIANFTTQKLEYRAFDGSWKPINEVLGDSMVAYNVVFKPGPLEFRRAANGSNTASKPATLTVIKVPGSKPQIGYNDIEDTVTIPAGEDWKNYEYKITIDGISSSWITGEELEKEDLSGSKKVEIRKKATSGDLSSEIQEIQFTDNLIKRVGLSTHVKPFELNGTTAEMQYRINGGTWKDCSKDTTKLIMADGTGLTDLSAVNIIEVCEMGNQAHTVIVYKK